MTKFGSGEGYLSKSRIIGYGLIFFIMLTGLALAIGGIAARHIDCKGNNCDNTFRYYWWIIFYTFGTWVGLGYLLNRRSLTEYKLPMVAFLAVGSSQTMPLADANLQQWQNCLNDVISPDEIEIIDYRCTSEFEDNASAAAAGFVIITICNLLWVVWAGSLKEPPPQQLKRESPNSVNTNGSTKKVDDQRPPLPHS
mmetsp:Transcript_6200/g.9282  ORF Transcript_6200/g.9282 Transcript_6200/m.9282 type:complete len:196 (-) Transcript_6200:167-754(-)